jgi:4-aminobutyrate aminotransferase/(S)-3-amino-2-methylpropionate transaminase
MQSIKLKTSIPGPKSRALMKRKRESVSNGIPSDVPVFAARGNGALLEDVDGNVFIDFSGGYGATNSGHGNARIVSAVKKQAEKFFHTCFSAVPYENYVAVCERLNRITPGKFRKKSVLFNSGAEAVENAVKIARKYTGRPGVISFEEGFHGRTMLALSLTGKVKPYKFGFGPYVPECYKLHYPYVYRKPANTNEDDYVDSLLEYVEHDFFKSVVAPENMACVVMELVAGEGGFIVSPKRYVRELRKICRENGILFIADEVQTGMGRTGKLFACEHYGIEPDLIIMAKSMSNGMPLSAVTGKKEIMDCVQEGGVGGTFSGHPVSCAAAVEAIDFIVKNNLAKKAQEIGRITLSRFREFQEDYEIVGDARGLGAMCAIEIVKDKKSKTPDREKALEIIHNAHRNGLVLLSAGLLGNDIRTLMPLTIPKNQLDEGLDVIEKAIKMSS